MLCWATLWMDLATRISTLRSGRSTVPLSKLLFWENTDAAIGGGGGIKAEGKGGESGKGKKAEKGKKIK